MARIALEDYSYEVIKEYILNPENSSLSPDQQDMFDRILSAAKVLDKNPIQQNAIALHMAKYPHIGKTRARLDLQLATRLFNTIHTFDYDLWQTWLINDIVKNINQTRAELDADNQTQKATLLKVIASEHANLIKAIGEKPKTPIDPHLTEKHEFVVAIQVNNQTLKLDYEKFKEMPAATLRELTQALFAGQNISETEAEEIMKS